SLNSLLAASNAATDAQPEAAGQIIRNNPFLFSLLAWRWSTLRESVRDDVDGASKLDNFWNQSAYYRDGTVASDLWPMTDLNAENAAVSYLQAAGEGDIEQQKQTLKSGAETHITKLLTGVQKDGELVKEQKEAESLLPNDSTQQDEIDRIKHEREDLAKEITQ